MMAWTVGNLLFLLAWGIVVAALMRVRPTDRQVLKVLRPISRTLLIGTMASILSIIWVLMPYAPADLRIVVAMFIIGYVAVMIMSMSELFEVVRVGIIVLIGSITLFFWIFDGPWTIAIVVFSVMFGIAMYVLSGVFPNALRQAIAARMDAEAQREAKARFLASASHDLGQPLQSARLFFDLAVRERDADRQAMAVLQAEAAFASVERQLHQIVEHLRLESGDVKPTLRPLRIELLIGRVASLAEAAAARAGVIIHAMPSRLTVLADADLVERALSNLADNAIRHAKAKRLLIGARRYGDRVRVWVIDDGVGISKMDRLRLFDDFVQGSDHGDEVRGGFGLGLASVRRMAAVMNGAVGLETHWKHGAAFFLDLPNSPEAGFGL